MKTVTRRYSEVVSIHLEIMTTLNDRLEQYQDLFGWSKRKIIEDAILCWVNQRDVERIQREGK